jgi:hypothetical protein
MATSSRRTRFVALGAVSCPVLDRYLAVAEHVCKRPPTRLGPRFRISGEEQSSSTPATVVASAQEAPVWRHCHSVRQLTDSGQPTVSIIRSRTACWRVPIVRPALGRVIRQRGCASGHCVRRPSPSCALRVHVCPAVADPGLGVDEACAVGRLDFMSQVGDMRAQRLSGVHVRRAPNLAQQGVVSQ